MDLVKSVAELICRLYSLHLILCQVNFKNKNWRPQPPWLTFSIEHGTERNIIVKAGCNKRYFEFCLIRSDLQSTG